MTIERNTNVGTVQTGKCTHCKQTCYLDHTLWKTIHSNEAVCRTDQRLGHRHTIPNT